MLNDLNLKMIIHQHILIRIFSKSILFLYYSGNMSFNYKTFRFKYNMDVMARKTLKPIII